MMMLIKTFILLQYLILKPRAVCEKSVEKTIVIMEPELDVRRRDVPHVVSIRLELPAALDEPIINTDNLIHELVPVALWLCHRLMGWRVLYSHLGTGSNLDWVFKGPVGRCKATLHPSSLSLASNRVTTNYQPSVLDRHISW